MATKKTSSTTSTTTTKSGASKKPAVSADVAPAADVIGGSGAAVKTTKARNSSVPPTGATKSRSTKSASGSAAADSGITNEMIAERAYHLWLAGTPGSHLDHWVAAEQELRSRK